jgi:hypothetical protein
LVLAALAPLLLDVVEHHRACLPEPVFLVALEREPAALAGAALKGVGLARLGQRELALGLITPFENS